MSYNPPPAYTPEAKVKLTQAVLDAVNGSQQQALTNEIKELDTDVKYSSRIFEEIYTLATQDEIVNKTGSFAVGTAEWKTTIESYNAQIRVTRSAAKEVNSHAIKELNTVLLPIAQDGRDDSAKLEFQALSNQLSKIKVPSVDFRPILETINSVKLKLDTKLKDAKAYEPEIEKMNTAISELDIEEREAKKSLKEIIPEFCQQMGIDSGFGKMALFLASAPLALVKCLIGALTGDAGKVIDGVNQRKRLEDTISTIEKCQAKLKGKKKELDVLMYKNGQQEGDHARWNVMITKLESLDSTVKEITPKLSSIAKISEAVKQDIDLYLQFLNGPNVANTETRKQAIANLGIANALYQTLAVALESFIIGI